MEDYRDNRDKICNDVIAIFAKYGMSYEECDDAMMWIGILLKAQKVQSPMD